MWASFPATNAELAGQWEQRQRRPGGFTIRQGYVIIIRYAYELGTACPAGQAVGVRNMEHTAGAGSPTIL